MFWRWRWMRMMKMVKYNFERNPPENLNSASQDNLYICSDCRAHGHCHVDDEWGWWKWSKTISKSGQFSRLLWLSRIRSLSSVAICYWYFLPPCPLWIDYVMQHHTTHMEEHVSLTSSPMCHQTEIVQQNWKDCPTAFTCSPMCVAPTGDCPTKWTIWAPH